MLGDIIALEIDMKSEPLNVEIDFQYYNINIGYYNKWPRELNFFV